MRVYTNEDRVYHIVMTAMMMCIIMLAIIQGLYILREDEE